MKLHLVHALPNNFLPEPGQLLRTEGLSVEKASELVKSREIVSHIRYEDLTEIVSQELGVKIFAGLSNCPSPFNNNAEILLCVRSPGETRVKYVRVYNGSSEAADHDWRYSMTWGA